MAYDVNNILDQSAIEDLFGDGEETKQAEETPQPEPKSGEENDEQGTTEKQTDYSIDDMFGSESGGSEEDDKQDNKEGASSKEDGSSQNKSNFYSSIANALVDEGTFQYLDKESIDAVNDVEGFAELFQKELDARLDDTQKRVNDALNYGIEPSEIQKYENSMNYLNGISNESIEDESEDGEKLRKQLIYTDFIQKGMSEDRAKREVKKSFDAGTDIDDAKDALESCKSKVKSSYDDLVKQARENKEAESAELKKRAETLRKDIIESESVFGDVKIDKSTRQKAYDSIMKPVFKTSDGQMLTAVQKYQSENPVEFLKNLGLLYTLTDGFKNIDKLVDGRVKKEKKEGLRQLEKVINSTSRNSDGSLNFLSGSKGSDDYFGKGGLRLDI